MYWLYGFSLNYCSHLVNVTPKVGDILQLNEIQTAHKWKCLNKITPPYYVISVEPHYILTICNRNTPHETGTRKLERLYGTVARERLIRTVRGGSFAGGGVPLPAWDTLPATYTVSNEWHCCSRVPTVFFFYNVFMGCTRILVLHTHR